ncbi:hypothetical protein [Fibrobacter sp.]|uniref:hypothetical protein n=1 Tax=Fibrobacter sp. TaxID=35828 RepID=UPI00388FD005
MTVPELTLKQVKETAKVKTFRASDFLTDEQIEEVHESNIRGRKQTSFNEIDAYIAEILARFGYDTYVAWKFGEISEENMAKFIKAERAREARNRLKIENIIVASVSGANNPTKTGHAPKSLKMATKMLKSEEKIAKGGE